MIHLDIGVIGIEVILILPLGAGAWKAGGLRSEIVDKFQARRDKALAKLEDQAIRSLAQIATRFSEGIGGVDGDPGGGVTFNPAELAPDVNALAKTLKFHSRLPTYFRILLRIGPVMTAALLFSIGALVVAFAYLSGWDHYRTSCVLSFWCLGACLIVAVVDAVLYFATLQLFTNAELLSASGSRS